MLPLPNEIIIQVISYADCYVKLVLSNAELDERQLFREGGPGLLLDKVLERGADRVLLTKMKERYFTRGARIPIYKAIAITKDPNVLSLVCSIWGSNVSDIGLTLSYQLRLCWGVKMLSRRSYNLMHIICNEMDKIDLSRELPRLYHIEDIIRCYQDENIRPLLNRMDLIVYHIRMGNDAIIQDMKLDTESVWNVMRGHVLSMPFYPCLLTRDEQIRLSHLRCRDGKYEGVMGPIIAAKLELWDETPIRELSRAVAERNYALVNKFVTEDHRSISKLGDIGMLPRTEGFECMDESGEFVYRKNVEPNLYYYRRNIINRDDGLTDGQWLVNHLLDHPEIKIHETTFGDIRLRHPIGGPHLDYVDEDNPGDIQYNIFRPYTNLQTAIRWYYRNRYVIATDKSTFRDRVDF
ncbi:unnamed protein product [Cunninghamella echinulata]